MTVAQRRFAVGVFHLRRTANRLLDEGDAGSFHLRAMHLMDDLPGLDGRIGIVGQQDGRHPVGLDARRFQLLDIGFDVFERW